MYKEDNERNEGYLPGNKRVTVQLPPQLIDVAKSYAGNSLSSVAAVQKVLDDLAQARLIPAEDSRESISLDVTTQREISKACDRHPSQWRRAAYEAIWKIIDASQVKQKLN
jgi:hypothetical protein